MSTPFDPDADLIYTWAEILGNTGKARLLLALDIGATNSMKSSQNSKKLKISEQIRDFAGDEFES